MGDRLMTIIAFNGHKVVTSCSGMQLPRRDVPTPVGQVGGSKSELTHDAIDAAVAVSQLLLSLTSVASTVECDTLPQNCNCISSPSLVQG